MFRVLAGTFCMPASSSLEINTRFGTYRWLKDLIEETGGSEG
jgi:hypothetical protein